MKKSVGKKWLFLFIAIILVVVFCYNQNNSIVTTEIELSSSKMPASFKDYKIVQLSDLHSKRFGQNQTRLVKKVNQIKPDLIVFTGDLVDANRYDEVTSLKLMEEMVQIAPTYFVTGNHEWWSRNFETLANKLNEIGVNVLRNEADIITIGENQVYIVGIDDPAYQSEDELESVEKAIIKAIQGLEEDDYKILLSHRPEMFELYAEYEFDIVFSGHAHGGQVRIPIVGGLIAPNQGVLPTYTSGEYQMNRTTMIVNRGLGNSIIPLRLFNRPEIIITSFKTQ